MTEVQFSSCAPAKKLAALRSLRIERGPEAPPPASAARRKAPLIVKLAPVVLGLAAVGVWQWPGRNAWLSPILAAVTAATSTPAPVAAAVPGTEADLAAGAADPVDSPVAPTASSARGISAVGYVVARRRTVVSAETTGRITAINFDEGQLVKAGAPLVELDASAAENAVELAAARVDAAQAAKAVAVGTEGLARENLRRTQALATSGVASRAALDQVMASEREAVAHLQQAEADLAASNTSLASAKLALSHFVVHAPMSGVVASRMAQLGEVVSAASDYSGRSSPLAVLVDRTSLEVEVDLNESFLPRIRAGLGASVKFDAAPGLTVHATVYLVVPEANRDKASVRVRLKFDSIDDRVLPEMTARVEFHDQVAISNEAAPPQGAKGAPATLSN
jgi:HlyD family secretion protein